jgi:hypothetical protein
MDKKFIFNVTIKIIILFFIGFTTRLIINYFKEDINELIQLITFITSMVIGEYLISTGQFLSK